VAEIKFMFTSAPHFSQGLVMTDLTALRRINFGLPRSSICLALLQVL
jgi:hypothetical protein